MGTATRWLGLMSPVIRLIHCAGCSKPIHPDATCSACGTPHGKAKHKARGYNLKPWRELRAQAIAAHPYCAACGSTSDLTGDHLKYPALTLSDVRVLCRGCNTRDANERARVGHRGGGASPPRKRRDLRPALQKNVIPVFGEKACPKCRRDLAIEEFSPNKATRTGLQSWCRDCMRDAVRESRSPAALARRRLALAAPPPVGKVCTKCKRDLDLGEFSNNRRMRDGKSSWCRSCTSAKTREWRASGGDKSHADRSRVRVVGCVDCGADTIGKSERRYCDACRSRRISAGFVQRNTTCVDCGCEFQSRSHNASMCMDCRHARGIAKDAFRRGVQSTGELPLGVVRSMKRCASDCPLCGVAMLDEPNAPRSKELDHVVPISLGGAHHPANVRVICKTCNASRGNKASDLVYVPLSFEMVRA